MFAASSTTYLVAHFHVLLPYIASPPATPLVHGPRLIPYPPSRPIQHSDCTSCIFLINSSRLIRLCHRPSSVRLSLYHEIVAPVRWVLYRLVWNSILYVLVLTLSVWHRRATNHTSRVTGARNQAAGIQVSSPCFISVGLLSDSHHGAQGLGRRPRC